MPYKNPQDQANYRKKHWPEEYARKRAFYIARAKKQKEANSKAFDEFKATLKCERCPESHPACLDFHHMDPSKKDFNIANVARRGYGLKRIKREIEKCLVLCSNCHRKLHYDLKKSVSVD